MHPQNIIAKKRDGRELSDEEIERFIRGVTDGSWADFQITALLMAMYLRGLNTREQAAITAAMLHSGEILDFSEIENPKADKHSTGGVGDKTSLIIGPVAAACGLAVPMISGRGLGHTGGTLDKLEAISGYRVDLTAAEFREIVGTCGYAMTGQTDRIAPADKRIYGLRDATATVSAIPLIVASIMSKKLAEGLDALVLDVKTGNGAFMSEIEDARRLGEALVETGNSCNVKTRALITDMNQPLGKFVGNALEVYECTKILRGEAASEMLPVLEVSQALTAQLLVLTGMSDSVEQAEEAIGDAIDSGRALERFRQNCKLQGGRAEIADDPEILLDKDLLTIEIKAAESGWISGVKTKEIGFAVSQIGGGRVRREDEIDHAVGYASLVKIGGEIRAGDPLGIVYCRTETQADQIGEKLREAYIISPEKPSSPVLIKDTIRES